MKRYDAAGDEKMGAKERDEWKEVNVTAKGKRGAMVQLIP